MEIIIVDKKICDKDIAKQEGHFFSKEEIRILESDADVYYYDEVTKDKKLLLKFRKNVIPENYCDLLVKCKLAAQPSRRPSAGGIPENEPKYNYQESKSSGSDLYVLTNQKKSNSGVVGYYDSTSNFGHVHREEGDEKKCRLTAYTAKHIDLFNESLLPAFQFVDKIYETLVPEYYVIQKESIDKIADEFKIQNTIFTTVTVNRNFRTALHCDSGDLKEGFGNLVVVGDNYTGGYTMFPQFGIGVDCRHGDFLAMDVHQWHCNSEILGKGMRLSFVFYLREKMLKKCPFDVKPRRVRYDRKFLTKFLSDHKLEIEPIVNTGDDIINRDTKIHTICRECKSKVTKSFRAFVSTKDICTSCPNLV